MLLVLVPLVAGCASPSRDPGAQPLPAGKGALLANVVNEVDQTRIAGAQVLVYMGGIAESDGLGHAVVQLSPGHYRATASKSGWEASPIEFDVKADEYTDVPIYMRPTSN